MNNPDSQVKGQDSQVKSMNESKLKKNVGLNRLLHLLIVEDVAQDVELILLTLESANIEFTYDSVSTATDFEYCLDHHVYDVVLSDYRLTNFNGSEAFKVLERSGKEIPFVLITGSLGEESAVEFIKAGMTDYVLKDRLFRLPMVLQRALDELELRHQQKAAIAQIQQQAWRETIINRIGQSMRETLVLEDILQRMADELHTALQLSRCLIFQPNSNDQLCITFVSSLTPDKSSLLDQHCPWLNHFKDVLAQAKQVALNTIDSSLPSEIQEAAAVYSLHSLLLTPLYYQQTYLGAINLHICDQPREWSEHELALVREIANQCAIAIHQAKLYQNAQIEIAERKKMEGKLRHDALHDALTNLPNRTLILDRLHHVLKRFQRDAHPSSAQAPNKFAVLFLDLDRFKVINDSLGHIAGDQMLQMVAQRLSAVLRAGDSLARLGGDEFVVLIEGIQDLSDAIEVVHRIHETLKKPMALDSHEVTVGASIGIVFSAAHYTHPAQLLRDADTAMYRAKSKQRGSYEVFDTSMHLQVMRQLQLEHELRHAIEHQELTLHYQPMTSLNSKQILGFEALVRWQHPERGLIPPNDFISIAEDTGLIIPIDLWVLREACQQLSKWQACLPGHHPLFMSVNFSGQQFLQSNLMSQIDQILSEVNLDPRQLRIELTESVLIEKTKVATEILNQLVARHIQVALDDFGTGYSSLSYLHRFPIHTLKIDRSFISPLGNNPENSEIVKTIVNLGLNLGLEIVAEGIETPEQLQFLEEHHCQIGQGYYFSKPLEAKAAFALLNQQTKIL
ncbi:MAG: EAL domain-containing protein [Thermosynechococcaceae cyanobacterium MS004]|nr:EAL domain-containing protein [Thermosynechococcaceae cyanobacterium MS004]